MKINTSLSLKTFVLSMAAGALLLSVSPTEQDRSMADAVRSDGHTRTAGIFSPDTLHHWPTTQITGLIPDTLHHWPHITDLTANFEPGTLHHWPTTQVAELDPETLHHWPHITESTIKSKPETLHHWS